jgi:hypothetical protein
LAYRCLWERLPEQVLGMSKPFIGDAVIVDHGFIKIAYFFFKHKVKRIFLFNTNCFLCFQKLNIAKTLRRCLDENLFDNFISRGID